MTEPRHTSFSGVAADDALRSAENARDIISALNERVPSRVFGPFKYAATGSTASKIGIPCTRRPAGVLLLNAYTDSDPSADLGAQGRCNFVWDAPGLAAQVFEPDGLTLDVVYDLTFLVVG